MTGTGPPTLYAFAGLPGSGKTTLSRRLAADLKAVHVRIDTIEDVLLGFDALRTGIEGYAVAYRVAADNLRLGLNVVADSVNPLFVTRQAWRDVAARTAATIVEIDVRCSDSGEHQARLAARPADDARPPVTWDDVLSRAFDPWDRSPFVIDTAGRPIDDCVRTLHRALRTG